jgi:hypothetical protein
VPSWFASLAIKYKKGKDKTAAFAHVMEQADDQKALAARLGVPWDTLVVGAETTTSQLIQQKFRGSGPPVQEQRSEPRRAHSRGGTQVRAHFRNDGSC